MKPPFFYKDGYLCQEVTVTCPECRTIIRTYKMFGEVNMENHRCEEM